MQVRAEEDFERAVRSEMDAIVGDVKDIMREQDRRAGPRADDRRLRDAGRDDRFQDTGRSFQDTGRSFQDTGRSFRDDRFQESKREESKNGGFFGADRSDGAGFFGGDSRPNSGASFGAAPVGAALALRMRPPSPASSMVAARTCMTMFSRKAFFQLASSRQNSAETAERRSLTAAIAGMPAAVSYLLACGHQRLIGLLPSTTLSGLWLHPDDDECKC